MARSSDERIFSGTYDLATGAAVVAVKVLAEVATDAGADAVVVAREDDADFTGSGALTGTGTLDAVDVLENENAGTGDGAEVAAARAATPPRLKDATAGADVLVANAETDAALVPLLLDAPKENGG